MEVAKEPEKEKRHETRNVGINKKTAIMIRIDLQTMDMHENIVTDALLDSGATALFIDTEFVKKHQLKIRKLPRAIPVYNVDGTLNQGGSITHEVDFLMTFQGHKERATFLMCDLGRVPIVIGHAWLKRHNPDVDWTTGEVRMTRCPKACGKDYNKFKKERVRASRLPPKIAEEVDDEEDEERVFAAWYNPADEEL